MSDFKILSRKKRQKKGEKEDNTGEKFDNVINSIEINNLFAFEIWILDKFVLTLHRKKNAMAHSSIG